MKTPQQILEEIDRLQSSDDGIIDCSAAYVLDALKAFILTPDASECDHFYSSSVNSNGVRKCDLCHEVLN